MDESMAANAALILTLYGKEAAIAPLADLLVAHLSLDEAGPSFWQMTGGEGWLRCFTPITNGDTAVVQLALNPPGPPDQAWPQARRQLEIALSETELAAKGVWGYSLIYQAVLSPGIEQEEAFKTLSEFTLRLHAGDGEVAPQLAGMEVSGGYLWQTHIPGLKEGPQAANVYVALGPAEGETTLIRWLATPHAPLLEPDLIVHKSSYLHRQYHRDNFIDLYKSAVKGLSDATSELLDELGSGRGKVDPLEAVAGMYDRVVAAVPILEVIHIQMTTQLANFDYRVGKIEDREVFAFQRGRLTLSLQELELLLRRGRNALEAAGTTVEMVQARLAKVRARQTRWLQILLALVAVALAVPELVDRAVAAGFLNVLLTGFNISLPEGGYRLRILFLTQLGLMLLAMAVAGVAVYTIIRLLARR